MRRTTSAIVALSLFACLSTSATRAQADPTRDEMEAARAMLRAGDELRGKKDFEGALAKYKTAHEIVNTPVTGYELAVAYRDVGKLVAAREAALGVVAIPALAQETAIGIKARADAATLARDIDVRIPRLRVRISGPGADAARVTIDDRPISDVRDPQRVDPGAHVVVATADAVSARVTVTVAERETRDVDLTLAPSTAPAPAPAPAPSSPVSSSSSGGSNVLGIVALSVGGVALAAGGITGAIALSRGEAVTDACGDARVCPRSAQEDYDASRTMGNVSTILFVVGGVGVVAGAALLLWPSAPARTADGTRGARVVPRIGVGYAGVEGRF